MKRTLCLFCALILAVGICFSAPVTITASAAEAVTSGNCGKDGDNLTWSFVDDTLTISGTGVMADYSGSDMPWYNYHSNITKVVIENGVTTIGNFAFRDCIELTSVTIGEGVTTISDRAFYNCEKLTSVTIPDGVTTIGGYAFADCRYLTSVIIGEGVTTIGDSAFYSCKSLTSVTIPDSVTTIGDSAFRDCIELTSVTIGDNVEEIGKYAFADCRYLTSVTIGDGVTTISDRAFFNCKKLTSVTIPDSVTTISEFVFAYCSSLTSVTIGKGVTEIDDYAFSGCENMTLTVVLGSYAHQFAKTNNIPYIFNDYSKAESEQIKKLTFTEKRNDNNEVIAYSVTGCDTSISGELKIPATYNGKPVTEIGDFAFADCTSLAAVTIPDSITTIGAGAFYFCIKLISITIPESVTTISNSAFYSCTALTSIEVDVNNSTYLSDDNGVLFNKDKTELICYPAGKDATSYTIPDGVKSIGDIAFFDCTSLTTIEIPDSVITIGSYAFNGCTALASVTIPDSVETIGSQAFSYCTSLTTVSAPCSWNEKPLYTFEDWVEVVIPKHTIENNNCTVCKGSKCGATESDTVTWVYDEGTLYINGTGAMVADYDGSNMPWYSYQDKITKIIIENGVTTIGMSAFSGCDNLTSVTIPKSVTTIGMAAFSGCGLTSVTIPESVTEIDDRAFIYCRSLTSVEIPESVTTIGESAFYGCSELTSVTIPESVTTIGESAFYGCSELTSVTIPGIETTIGDNAFSDCPKVTLLVEENSNAYDYASENNIEYITYVGGSGELGKLTFSINEDGESYSVTDCDKSISGALTIPNKFNGKSVTKIGNNAFSNCTSLTSVEIPDSVVSLGEMAFYDCGKLETVTLSNKITEIPKEAFACCKSLKKLPITENITSIGECAFNDSGEHGSVSLSGVTIGTDAFRNCGITELTLENCKLNGKNIFANNTIKKLTLSETNIPDEMFYGDSYIKTLVAEDSVLGSNSFKSCHTLKSVTVFGGEINAQAFLACSSLETVTIDNIDSVGEFAFNNCQALKTVEVNATEISEYAFSMCTSLENVKLSDGVEVIRDAVFEGCDSLAELELPETVTEISDGAFAGCSNLKYIFFEGTEDAQKTIGDALGTNARIHYGSSTHTFNENYTVDVEPTCTEKGSESQHCKYCEKTQNEREIPCLIPGEIEAELDNSNSFSATVEDVNSITAKLKLTDEEKELISNGADMKIVFKLSDIGSAVNTAEKEAILNALTKGEIGTFLDIQLVKQIGGMSTNVKNLSGLISVSVELPAELINNAVNVKRSYSVLRYHDGDEQKVTTLNSRYDEATHTLTFDTDRFSTYAIVYSDVVVSSGEGVPGTPDPGDGEVSTPENPKDETTPGTPETPKDEITPDTPETPKDDVSNDKNDDSVTNDKNDASSETGTNDKNDTSKDDVPKAGVISTTSIWLGAMAISGFGALLVSKKKKED